MKRDRNSCLFTMMKLSKDEIQKYYFDNFARLYKLPPGEILYDDKPDIIIEGETKIGIEITNFYCLLNRSRNSLILGASALNS